MTRDDILRMAHEAAKAEGLEPMPFYPVLERFANLVVAFKPKQEPIAWMVCAVDGKSAYVTDNPNDLQEGQSAYALYPGPFERKPLTDEEIEQIGGAYTAKCWKNDGWSHAFARAIEAAHGITEPSHA